MYKINNSKTTVKEVFLENRPTTNGDHYHVCYREGGNTTSKTAGTTAAFKPGSLEQVEEDHFKARMTNGDVCHFYVTKNSVTYNNESFRFSKQGANEEEEEKKEKKQSKRRKSSDSDEESCCFKLLFTIIPILPIWWIMKLIPKFIYTAFRSMVSQICSCCDAPDDSDFLPAYSFKKF